MSDPVIVVNSDFDPAELSPEERQEIEAVVEKAKEAIKAIHEEERRKEEALTEADKLIRQIPHKIDSYTQGRITVDELFKISDQLPTERDREDFKRKLFSYGISQSNHKLFEKLDYDGVIDKIYINDLLKEAIMNRRLRTARFIIEKSLNCDAVKIDESFSGVIDKCLNNYEYGMLSYLLEEPSNSKRQQFHDVYDFKNSLDIVYDTERVEDASLTNEISTKFCYLLLNHGAFLKDEHCAIIQETVTDPLLVKASKVDEKIREEVSNIMYGRNRPVSDDFAVQCMLNSKLQEAIKSGAELEFDEVLEKLDEWSSFSRRRKAR